MGSADDFYEINADISSAVVDYVKGLDGANNQFYATVVVRYVDYPDMSSMY